MKNIIDRFMEKYKIESLPINKNKYPSWCSRPRFDGIHYLTTCGFGKLVQVEWLRTTKELRGS